MHWKKAWHKVICKFQSAPVPSYSAMSHHEIRYCLAVLDAATISTGEFWYQIIWLDCFKASREGQALMYGWQVTNSADSKVNYSALDQHPNTSHEWAKRGHNNWTFVIQSPSETIIQKVCSIFKPKVFILIWSNAKPCWARCNHIWVACSLGVRENYVVAQQLYDKQTLTCPLEITLMMGELQLINAAMKGLTLRSQPGESHQFYKPMKKEHKSRSTDVLLTIHHDIHALDPSRAITWKVRAGSETSLSCSSSYCRIWKSCSFEEIRHHKMFLLITLPCRASDRLTNAATK